MLYFNNPMKQQVLYAFFFCFMHSGLCAHNDTNCGDAPVSTTYVFNENKGQWDSDIEYRSRWGSTELRFKKNGFSCTLFNTDDLLAFNESHHNPEKPKHTRLRGHNYDMRFIDSNLELNITAEGESEYVKNYFIGNDPRNWATNVREYERLLYEELYDGVSAVYYLNNGNIKYDLIIDKNTDPSVIKWAYTGLEEVLLEKDGIHLCTEFNEIIENNPIAYQEINGHREYVACQYVLSNGVLSYGFPEGFNKDLPLIIDPELEFATYSGSLESNWGITATYDEDGALYAGSVVFGDNGYPTTAGAWEENNFGSTSMALTKFSTDGRRMIYSTYLGGDQTEVPSSLIVNTRNELVILGTTSSSDFPTTNGAIDRTFNGGPFGGGLYDFNSGADICLTVLSENGDRLVGSTFLGGTDNEGTFDVFLRSPNYGDELRQEIILDDDNNIYVASNTQSSDFPTTVGSFNEQSSGGYDAVVFKTNDSLTDLIWSTYIGGSDTDAAFSIRLDESARAYICGLTSSNDFPVSTDAPQTTGRGVSGFVGRLAADGTSFERSTFISESSEDVAFYLDLDTNNNIVIFGQTRSDEFPITPGTFNQPGSGNFLIAYDQNIERILFSTTIGNSTGIQERLVPSAFLVDNCDQIYISTWFGSTNGAFFTQDYPLTSDAFRSSSDGSDFYLCVLEPNATDIIFGSYFGGESSSDHVDGGTSRFDKNGIVYQAVCASCGAFDDFPTSPGAFSSVNASNGGCNLGVFKLDFELAPIDLEVTAGPRLSGCAPLTVDFISTSVGVDSFFWFFGEGLGESNTESPQFIYTDPGEYQVVLIATPKSDCSEPDTLEFVISVSGTANSFNEIVLCPEQEVLLNNSGNMDAISYLWSTGDTSETLLVMNSGLYILESDLGDCIAVDSFNVIVNNTLDAELILESNYNGNAISCAGGSDGIVSIQITGGSPPYSIEWADHDTEALLRDNLESNTYSIEVIDALGCVSQDTISLSDPDPLIVRTINSNIKCTNQGSAEIIVMVNGGVPAYTYSINNNPFQTDSIFSNISDPGVYSILVQDSNGCIEEESVTVSTDNEAINIELISALGSELGRIGETLRLDLFIDDLPEAIDSIVWEGTDNDGCLDCTTQIVTLFGDSYYYVTVYKNDCFARDSVFIRVSASRNIYIPNVFSPNFDGSNDLFTVYSPPGAVRIVNNLKIFNRWGGLVFNSTAFTPDQSGSGWNGLINGEPAQLGVYVYMVEVEFADGETKLFSGDLTLIR